MQAQYSRVAEGSSQSYGLKRHLRFQRQLSGGQSRHHDDIKSPSHSVGSHDMGSNNSFDRRRVMSDKSTGSLYKNNSQKEQEKIVNVGAEVVETIIARTVCDPLHVMAQKFHEMTTQSMVCLKESIREIILNADKRLQLCVFQKALQNRSDITMEMLMKSHRCHLEILVALKTALPEFLQHDHNVTYSDLAEVFFNLKCRNIAYRSLLPVDECDCKVCGQKNGFCGACMCLVCSKFDMASNTCSWIGCDVCLHWCHTDCALCKFYIRNGYSASGAEGTSETQFHCVSCNHPSEMFGFVKEVFLNFAKEWTDGDSSKVSKTIDSSVTEQNKWTNGISGPSQETTLIKSDYPEKVCMDVSASLLTSYNCDQ